jgi:hypothetical protein
MRMIPGCVAAAVAVCGMVGGSAAAAQQSTKPRACADSVSAARLDRGTTERGWITDLTTLRTAAPTTGTRVRVSLVDVVVGDVQKNGFWIRATDDPCELFVIPAEGNLIHVRTDEFISLRGELRSQPTRPATRTGQRAETRYVYAYVVRPAW